MTEEFVRGLFRHRVTAEQVVDGRLHGQDMWLIDWQGTEFAGRIRELFGTTLVPTPYHVRNMEKAAVLQLLERRRREPLS